MTSSSEAEATGCPSISLALGTLRIFQAVAYFSKAPDKRDILYNVVFFLFHHEIA